MTKTNAATSKKRPAASQKRAKAKAPPRPYHHGELRDALVDASIAILAGEGSAALTLRSAARRVGVSHAAPKNHFGDLAGLLEAVAAVGFRRLTAALLSAKNTAHDEGAPALARFVAIGAAYVRFAVETPGHFRAMFHPALGERAAGSPLDVASAETFAVLVRALEEAHTEGAVRRGDVLEQALAAWSLVHGLSTLAVDRHLARKGFAADPIELSAILATQLYFGLAPVPK